jgi:hypothetical protein
MTRADILALGVQTENRLIYATDTKQFFAVFKDTAGSAAVRVTPQEVPHNAGNLTGAVSLDRANGEFQKAALTGNITLSLAAGTEGQQLRVWLTPSGSQRQVTLNAAIKVPTDAPNVFPRLLDVNKGYALLFQHNGTAWCLISTIGGF